MQAEIDAEIGEGRVELLGCNENGHANSNDAMCEGRSLPWLQDTAAIDVWKNLWRPVYRDVVILAPSGTALDAYNLTEHNLADAENYAELKALLIAAATE